MPANYLGFSMGEALKDAESIKTSKQNRQINQFKLDDAKESKTRNALIGELRSQAVTGDADSQKKLLALDPENGPKVLESIRAMDQSQRDITKQNNETLGQMSAQVLSAPPERREALYQSMLEQLPDPVKAKAPPQYNENWMRLSMAKVRALDDILSNPQSVSIGGEEVLYKDGQEVERAAKPLRKGDAGVREVESKDSRLFKTMAADSLGGILDEEGNIRGLGPEDAAKAVAMQAEAERRWKDNPDITQGEAFAEVAREFGMRIPTSAQATDPNDPNAIRQFLIQDNR